MTRHSADSTASEGADAGLPPIAELRTITQTTKTKSDRRWSYLVFRRLSIYITWCLLHTKITANQVTVLSLFTALAGLGVLGLGPRWAVAVGLALLMTYHLLDRVDGEVARYRGVTSIHGIYLDNVGHHITAAGVLISAGYSLRDDVGSPTSLLLLAAVGGVASSLARVAKHAAFQLHTQYVMEDPTLASKLPEANGPLTRSAIRESRAADSGQKPGFAGSAISLVAGLILTWTQFPATIALLFVAWAVDAARGGTTVSTWALIVVCGLQIAAYVAAEVANLSQNLASEARRLWQRDIA